MTAPKITPSASAMARRRMLVKERSETVPAVAQELATKIVDAMEPGFSEAYGTGTTDTFEQFVFQEHRRAFDHNWLVAHGLYANNLNAFPLLYRLTEQFVKEQLLNRYGITADVSIYNSGFPEFVLDWYVCEIKRPQKRSSWRGRW